MHKTFHLCAFQSPHGRNNIVNDFSTENVELVFLEKKEKKHKCNCLAGRRNELLAHTHRETKHVKSGKEKSQTINYRDKCAREWSQISFYTTTATTKKWAEEKTTECNARVANSMQQGNGWTSNNKTQKTTVFKGPCVVDLLLFFLSLHLWRMLISVASRVDRTEWLEPLWHCCSSHHHLGAE